MRIRRAKEAPSSSSSSSSSSKHKKQKSLDSICEKEYNRNRNNLTIQTEEETVRRSSRVRKAPVLLDVSPSPKKKKRKLEKIKVNIDEDDDEDEGSSSWKRRLRSTVHTAERFDPEPRKRKLVYESEVVKVKSKPKDDQEHNLVEDAHTEGNSFYQCEESEVVKVKSKPKDDQEHNLVADKALEDAETEGNLLNQCEERVEEDLKDVEKAKEKESWKEITGKKKIRQGRRCGLCGRGMDGKPPKRLVDTMDSDHEAYGGSSSCDEGNYDVLDGFSDEPGWLGRLLGPIHDRFGIADVWVHQHCAVWSPEVYFAGVGCLKNVRAALFRGKQLKCSRCGRPGATIGCRVDRCPKTYHLPCGRANGCIFDHRKFLIACSDHRHLFEPHTNNDLQKLKKIKAKKLKLETRKLSHDAWRKDIEEEEKWLENCGEDEEFLKREGKRLHRDILRIAPVYIGGSSTEKEKLYQGWESVAGLQDVIRCLKEVVLLPLLYPDFFTTMGLTPPRGVLLHGYPGTGKTHVVRALIGSCARGDRRIAYFARKGADCLGKYVGDAERQLRLLFQVAEKSQPSIIFFDEIDGLAPCRTRQQDQTHNSVVSTLLALMDGLKSRGSVIVIGATNRPDAVDPALRRPGRFDREIYFPLPSFKDRASILSLHTRSWPKPLSGSLLKRIVQRTNGFAGADLQALCTQAAMTALKRNCPLQEFMLAAEKKTNGGRHHPLPSCLVEETDWLDALASAPPPCSRREAGMAANDVISSPLHAHLVPCLLQPLCDLLISLYLDERIWLPPLIYKAAEGIKTVIVSSLDQKEKPSELWGSCIKEMVKEADIARQIERTLSSAGFVVSGSSFSNYHDLPNDYDVGNESEMCKVSSAGASSRLSDKVSCLGRKTGFRILIAGNPKSGQRHLASCLLHGFVGCVEIQKVDLATISQEGHGDIVDGMTSILSRCSSKGSCVIYMPRIDLWALETQEVDENEDDLCATVCESSDTKGPDGVKKIASRAWSSFMEQVDSISLSASLMILATSEVPSENLPHKISHFFGSKAPGLNNSFNSEHAMPRFTVQVGESFDHDKAIDSSAMQLSKDLVQQYLQLLHHRTHAAALSNKPTDAVVGSAAFVNDKCSGKTDGSYVRMTSVDIGASQTTEHKEAEGRVGHPQDTVPRVLCNSKPAKNKCSMLLSISSFGYQILRYPHFAELCWTTSKLKEGPCADINGPWKGWPFNSCILRPDASLQKNSPGRSSNNLKSKGNFGVVRGLIAVGLLAYKGVYSSTREVCFEVRKVLELLVEQVNAKILAGKDGSQFFDLLSQVAYLEDMVKSWAYTLQSLEGDSSVSAKSPVPLIEHYRGDHYTSECNVVGVDACNPDVTQNDSNEVNLLEQSDIIGSKKEVTYHDLPDLEARTKSSEAALATSDADPLARSSTLDSPTTVDNKPNSGSKGSNKDILLEKIVLPSEDHAHKSDGVGENANTSLNGSDAVSSVSRLPCLYSCCFNCIDLVHVLIRKVLMREWKTMKNSWTVDDAHDAFCSWSTSLHSAVRNVYATESVSSSEFMCKNASTDEIDGRLCKCCVDHGQPNGNLNHVSSGNSVVRPVECSFHSKSSNNASASTHSQLELGLKFCYKDNVLISSDLDNDVSFHCKFQNLCLNSLIESILMIKQRLS